MSKPASTKTVSMNLNINVNVVIEKTNTGYSAYIDTDGVVIGTTSKSIKGLKKELQEAVELFFE